MSLILRKILSNSEITLIEMIDLFLYLNFFLLFLKVNTVLLNNHFSSFMASFRKIILQETN